MVIIIIIIIIIMYMECENKMDVFGGSVQMKVPKDFMFQVWKQCIKCKTQVTMF
jgi:hypothetical protein